MTRSYIFIAFVLLFTCNPSASSAQTISGYWSGKLETTGRTLDVSFHITRTDSGLRSTLSIIQQGLQDHPADSTRFSDSTLFISVADFNITYRGTLDSVNVIRGAIRQGGSPRPLDLKNEPPQLNRPQTPQPPFPYRSEDIRFVNEIDGIELVGTLTVPSTNESPPLAVIISGSGPQDRDGTMFGHQSYAVLADQLTRRGIAIFRFDERGVGASEGRYDSASLQNLVDDVAAAVDVLQKRSDLHFSQIGLVGHSLGGIIAAKLGAERGDIGFAVLMASPGLPGAQLMLQQKADMERALGVNELQIAQGQMVFGGAYELINRQRSDDQNLRDSLDAYFVKQYGPWLPPDQKREIIEQLMRPEIKDLLRSVPAEFLSEIRCPVLAVFGGKDLQVAAEPNLKAMEHAMASNPDIPFQSVVLADLNHMFQRADTGTPREYAQIEQTMSPVVIDLIADWILDSTD